MTQRLLNPFALSSETNGRFRLLVLLALALAIENGVLLKYLFFVDVDPARPTAVQEKTVRPAPTDGANYTQEFQSWAQEEADAARTSWLRQVVEQNTSLLLSFGVFALAYLLYRRHPNSIAKRSGVRSPSLPSWDSHLGGLVARMGLAQTPMFELARRGGEQGGQAYGLPGRYVVQLGDRMRLVFARARDKFDALVLHELAHIANRDIGRSYFVQALWVALAALVWLPLVLGIGYFLAANVMNRPAGMGAVEHLAQRFPVGVFFRLAGAYLLVLAVRASVLRAREVFADARAAQAGARETLVSIFEAAGESATPRWRGIFRLHPTPAQRAAALRDPAQLFTLHPMLSCAAGILQGAALTGLFLPVLLLLMGIVAAGTVSVAGAAADLDVAQAQGRMLASTIAMLLASALIGLGLGWLWCGTVVPQLIRASVAGKVGFLRRLGLAFLAGIGFEVGLGLTMHGRMWYGPSTADHVFWYALFGFAAETVVAFVTLGLAAWNTHRWIKSATGAVSPRKRAAWITVTCSLVSGSGLFAVLGMRMLHAMHTEAAGQSMALGMLVALVVIFLGTIVLAAFPWCRRASACPRCCTRLSAAESRVGQACPRCHAPLGEWLYAEDRLEPPPLPTAMEGAEPPPLVVGR